MKHKRKCRKYLCLVVVVLFCSAIICWKLVQEELNTPVPVGMLLVPNTVHYIIFDQDEIDFVTFVSLVSAVKVQNPEKIVIHTNKPFHPKGSLYSKFESLISNTNRTELEINIVDKPTHVYGVALSSVWHSSDISRILTLQKYGGIYLDTDQIILKNLDEFRQYEMTIGWPDGKFMGTQILIASPGAKFLQLWLESYKNYKPRMWYYSAGEFPTTSILQKHPELVHREKIKLGVEEHHEKLWNNVIWREWENYYSIHALARHKPKTLVLDENNYETIRCPFSDIARKILKDLEPVL